MLSEEFDVELLIVGGNETNIKTYSYAAHIFWMKNNVTGDGECGGTIIGREWIITAAHCIKYLKDGKRRVNLNQTEISAIIHCC